MKARKSRKDPAPTEPPVKSPDKPPWAHHLDHQERPNREDLGAGHNVFMDSMLGPMPKWLRGKRAQREKLS